MTQRRPSRRDTVATRPPDADRRPQHGPPCPPGSGARTRRRVFERIFATWAWPGGETPSGRGSTLAATEHVVRVVDAALVHCRARSLLDAGCGVYHWFRGVRAPYERHVGVDVVGALVVQNAAAHGDARHRFLRADFVTDPLPAADLILCRDALQHLPVADVRRALDNFRRSGSTYLLATSFTAFRGNADGPPGPWRPLNLCAPPFDLPQPLRTWPERCPLDHGRYRDKSLLLWRLADL